MSLSWAVVSFPVLVLPVFALLPTHSHSSCFLVAKTHFPFYLIVRPEVLRISNALIVAR